MTDENATTAAPSSAKPVEMPEATNPGAATHTATTGVATSKASPADAPSSQKNDVSMEDAPEPPLVSVNGHAADSKNANQASASAEAPEHQPETKSVEAEPSKAPSAPETPLASAKKASNGSAKKRSSGVPEHRSRKLNKKKSKPTLHLDATPGALFLARIKGYQPWPSIVCDEDMLPAVLIQSRPVTAAQADGSFKKADYAEGGRREGERTFPVMFLYTNEFAWIPNTDLTSITPGECGEATDKQKQKALVEAYKVAAEGHDLNHFKQVLLEHQEMLNAEVEAKAEREAEREAKKVEKATKQKRKSDAAVASAEDKMDVDDGDESSKSKPKKRKKETGADDDEKPAKTPKTTQKLKLNVTPKTPASETSKKKAPKAKSATKKSAAKGSDEDDAPKVQEEVLSPAQIREKKEKEVRYIRHKMQKGFLARDDVPEDDEMEALSNYLSKIEAHPDLESAILRNTKIHKVLKAMIRLESIPKDEVFQFKKRARELLDKWNKTLASDPAAGTEKEEEGKAEGTHPKSDEREEAANAAPSDEKAGGKAEAKAETVDDKPSEVSATGEPEKRSGEEKANDVDANPSESTHAPVDKAPPSNEAAPSESTTGQHQTAPESVEATA